MHKLARRTRRGCRDLAVVRVAYQTDLVLTERLVAADPTNTQWQHDLSVSYANWAT